MKKRTVSATQFRSQCLGLLDEVEKTRGEIVITRRGRPVARLVPLRDDSRRRKPTLRILGDIVNFSEPEWIA